MIFRAESSRKESDGVEENKNIQDEPVVRSGRTGKIVAAVVIAAVIVLNIVASVLGDARLWYLDMTRTKYKSAESPFYTLSDECADLIASDAIPMVRSDNAAREARGEERIKVKVIFCADRDYIESTEMMRYVSYTARALEKEFPEEIEVEYINATQNPSAIQKYKTTSASNIYSSDVIVEFGSEYLVQSINSFYYIDDTETTPWAYNGEKKLASMILALTRAESPICCITTNHGEGLFDLSGAVKSEYSTFLTVIEGAGYDIEFIDLERDEIPENCRMMITFAPTVDFKAYGNLGEGNVSEIEKLDKYLDAANAFFYICDRNSPKLTNLEEYLEEGGVTVASVYNGTGDRENLEVYDKISSLDSGDGNIIIGEYTTSGLGASLTEDMREAVYPAKVIFGSSTAIKLAENYKKVYVRADEDAGTAAFDYYHYYKNGVSRNMHTVFMSSATAYAEIGGEQYQIATDNNRFALMTVTQETRQVQEDNFNAVNQASYVIALSSSDFARNEILESRAYGNTDVLTSTLRNLGNEVVPTNVDLKAYYQYEVEDTLAYSSIKTDAWSKWLIISPVVVALVAGVVVNVRRRYR